MHNVIKIKTDLTEEWVEAVVARHKNVRASIWEHYKGESTYIVQTKDIQELFELGKAFGIAIVKNGKYQEPRPQGKKKATRGKGNE